MRAGLDDPANDSDHYGRQPYTFASFGVTGKQRAERLMIIA